jgi:ribosomal-protein-alanine N-acetyltransferase
VGQGLGTEALTAAIRFGFSEMQLNRIEAETIADNDPSTRLLDRLGFALEGTRRSYWKDDGTFHDGATYGLLQALPSPQPGSRLSRCGQPLPIPDIPD